MATVVGILRFITVFCSGIGSASLLTVLLVVVPLAGRAEPQSEHAIRANIDHLMDRFNPIMIVLSSLAGIALLILRHDLSRTSGTFTALGVVGMLGIIALSLAVIAPISRDMAGETQGRVPEAFASAARRWEQWHQVRTASGLIGFAAFTIAALT